jgi:hypothetical protein
VLHTSECDSIPYNSSKVYVSHHRSLVALPRSFEELISEAEKASFSGWDFSWLKRRYVEDQPTWNYPYRVRKRIKRAQRLLEMGTGGGEFLSTLKPLPKETYATEGYAPNVPITKKHLEPIGVKVVPVDSTRLPFEDGFFDLTINRHEEYEPSEVYRTLCLGGHFLTQQVGGKNNIELVRLLDLASQGRDRFNVLDLKLSEAMKQLELAGFKILLQKEEFNRGRFYDVGALVYCLKVIPWDLPNFSVDRYRVQLRDIHELILDRGSLEFSEHRFFIEACKVPTERFVSHS